MCVDVRLPPGGGSIPALITQLLGSGFTVHLHSAGLNRAIGGVLFIAGPRVTHKRLSPVCKYGTTAVLKGRFGTQPIQVVGTYWSVKNLKGEASLWNRMLEKDCPKEDHIDPITQVKSHILTLCAEAPQDVIIVACDFNTDVGRADVYDLTGMMQQAGLSHSASSSDLALPTYVRSTRAGTRLNYQLLGGLARAVSCEVIDDYRHHWPCPSY